MPFAGQNRHHAQRIIGPVLAPALRQRCCIEDAFFFEVFRVDDDLAVVARRNPGQRSEVDRRRHHEALGIIGVFADQIHAPRRGKNRRFTLEAAHMQRTQNFRVMHCCSLSIRSISTSIGQLKQSPGSSTRDHVTRLPPASRPALSPVPSPHTSASVPDSPAIRHSRSTNPDKVLPPHQM